MASTSQSISSESAGTDVSPDGRRERGVRNKAAVVAAILELYEIGEYQPSAARVAEIAGVSERSVFRYFDDMEDLASAAISQQWDRIRRFYEGLDQQGDFETRLESIVDHRLRLYDKVLGVSHAAALIAIRSATVATALEQRRSFLRTQAVTHFAAEIAECDDPAMTARLVDVALSLETLQYLDNSLGLSKSKLRDTILAALRAALDRR